MYLVNTSFAVEPDIQERWLHVIKQQYIPLLRKEGYRIVALSRVISADTPEHFTYSLLVDVPDIGAYRRLTEEMMAEYTQVAGPLFGTRAIWFTSLMKKLEI